MRESKLYPCDIYLRSRSPMSEEKLDKPSQIQFAEAITENIPDADKSILPGLAAAYISAKAYKRVKKR